MDQWLGIIERTATCLFSCANKRASYVYKLEENVESLRGKWNQLQQMFNDINIRIQTAEYTGEMQRKNEVEGWLQDVGNLQKDIKDVLDSQEIRENKCLRGYCSKNCVFSYKVGKKIVKNMIPNADELLYKGKHFGSIDIANKLPPKPVNEMQNVETVGLDLILNEVWNSIGDENINIIGLYGMAGVGKTTLLRRIHNEFGKRKHDFTLVLWVVVSKDCDTNRIMNDIRNRIGIDDDARWENSNKEQREAKIYQVLKQKKFVLMIDDLWDELKLETVGVPNLKETNNKSKVLFTTRIKNICAKMQAQRKFEVRCLLKKESFDLFCRKVGDETLKSHTEIPKLAWEMTKECAGLPLALTTVGGAMAGVKNINAWKQAKYDLRRSAWTASEWENKVFNIIMFSFDRLPDDAHKKCFLYCALYPEDHEINNDDLILRWIGEGFLGEDMSKKSTYHMYEQGESIIEKLKLSCLLEEGGVEFVFATEYWRRVKMHDVIRDMALWISRDRDQNKDKVLVQEEALALSEIDSERLNLVEKISIISSSYTKFKVRACPNLITLCLGRWVFITDYSNITFMKRLKVLDLSHSCINFLPSMRRRLPVELKSLKNLRVFVMESLRLFRSDFIIPSEVIESLEQLKVFRFSSKIFWPQLMFFPNLKGVKKLLEKLESLPKLEELHIPVKTITTMHKLLESNKLRDCTRYFKLDRIYEEAIEMPSLLTTFSGMKNLENITFNYVYNIIEGSLSITNPCYLCKLRRVEIHGCSSITHLTWLVYAPLLEFLGVSNCLSIKEVVREVEDEADVFPNLKLISLRTLVALESIHSKALDFPSLKIIDVYSCYNLRKLPLNSNSSGKDSLVKIRGGIKWWNNLV
ncbi:probable disease resistance protein At5g63020 [Lotus japonicus]|uniref:probable disease resistance protein At5g63020 n=1 Tax=Lotus japonicus TaxID=34305 RepID=UPI00258ECDF8|nr:probable disease resistance protein At5g63020 [Lotus japonicus]XP_057416278.1 probable disease resistance protein At5g63020 [Lotus japonicus]